MALAWITQVKNDSNVTLTLLQNDPSPDYAARPFVADWQRKYFHFRLIAHGVARP